jgi:hypothetical protein
MTAPRAVVPPLGLLALGAAFIWAFAGFRSDPPANSGTRPPRPREEKIGSFVVGRTSVSEIIVIQNSHDRVCLKFV